MKTFQAALKIQRAWRVYWNLDCPKCRHCWCTGRTNGSNFCQYAYFEDEW